jgi:copper chaperone CopZ
MLIDMTVGELDGVSSVQSDHVGGTTVVTFDPEKVTTGDIVAAIEGAGYEAEPES